MAEKNLAARLKEIDDQRTQLDQERARLQDELKSQALANAQAAVENLNSLGFNYRLVEGGSVTPRATRGPSTGTRRTGIREQVYDAVKGAGPDGTTRSKLIEAMGFKGEKSGESSISNALTALNKGGRISLANGTYRAA